MYLIIVQDIPLSNPSELSIRNSRIVDEETAKSYKEVLPTKIGSTLTVRTFPNSWDMILTTVTKVA